MVHRRVILARHLGVYELKVAFTFLMLESEEEASFVTCDSDRPSSVRQGSLMGTCTRPSTCVAPAAALAQRAQS